jgi:polyvinyl alcohol dehydrogenase (cytochrome)
VLRGAPKIWGLFVAAAILVAGPAARSATRAAVERNWPGHGFNLANWAWNAEEREIRASTAHRLTMKWRFPVNEMVATTPAVVDGIVYFGTWEGIVYALAAQTGEKRWSFDARALAGSETAWKARGIGIRGGLTVDGGRVYVGDTAGYLMALDAKTGALAWRTRLENHPHVRVFSAAKIYEGRIYIGVSSLEESAIRVDERYNGYTFRGSVVSLDAATGKEIWRLYTIPVPAAQIGTKDGGRPVFGPAGAAVWATPTIDPVRRLVYAATGNAYSGPEEHLKLAEAILAIEMDTGKLRWSNQAMPGAKDIYTNERLGGDDEGPDYDFGSSPILMGGRDNAQFLACGQKSGWLYWLDAATGRKVWETKVGAAGGLGGIEFGMATDGRRIFAAIASGEGNVGAIDSTTGKILWQTWNGVGVNHAPVVIAGPRDDLVVFEGSNRGVLRAFRASDGQKVWEHSFAKGTSIQGGAVVAGGMMFVGGGFHSALGDFRKGEGNELRAFALGDRPAAR